MENFSKKKNNAIEIEKEQTINHSETEFLKPRFKECWFTFDWLVNWLEIELIKSTFDDLYFNNSTKF